MKHFTSAERAAFNSLSFDPEAAPYFDPMRWCLRWPDEEPRAVFKDTYEKFIDLLIVRSFIHLRKPQSEWYSLEPTTYFVEAWEAAQAAVPLWPGFRRQRLSSRDRKFFESERKRDLSEFI